eukprot:801583_1
MASLITPNFHGLWTVSRLGHAKERWLNILVFVMWIIVPGSWLVGPSLPLIIVLLCATGCYTTALLISAIIIPPYVIPIAPNPALRRFFSKYWGQYFEGG